LTVSRRFLAKLETARHARSHAKPNASAEVILEEALDLMLLQAMRRRGHTRRRQHAESHQAGLTQGPDTPAVDASPRSPGSAHVPAEVRAAVWTRDDGRCQWPLDSGAICGSTWRPELDHIHPRARGGPSSVANLRVLCRFHNDLAARQVFGDAWMDQATSRRPSPRPTPAHEAAAQPEGGLRVCAQP
jgi:hypothetical protein